MKRPPRHLGWSFQSTPPPALDMGIPPPPSGGGAAHASLIKYDTPSLLTTRDAKPAKFAKAGSGKKLPPVESKMPQVCSADDLSLCYLVLRPCCLQQLTTSLLSPK